MIQKSNIYKTLFEILPSKIPKGFYQNENVDDIKYTDLLKYKVLIKILSSTIESFEEEDSATKSDLQKLRLITMIEKSRTTTWWRERLKESFNTKEGGEASLSDILENIPVTTRFQLIDIAKKDLLTVSEKEESIVWRNSGGSTTGTPFVWALNKELLVVSVFARFLYEFKLRKIKIPFWGKSPYYLEFNYPHTSQRSEFKQVSMGDFNLYSTNNKFDIHVLEKHGGLIVRTVPTELIILTEEIEKAKIEPRVSVYSITGQQLLPETRDYLEKKLNTEILPHYGAQEIGPLSFECRANPGSYHIFEERVIVEILSEVGVSAPGGEIGEITITVLDNFAMPLIRYQLGDLGTLTNGSTECSCGKKSPLLTIMSRNTDFLISENGVKKTITQITKRFNKKPLVGIVRRFQLIQNNYQQATLTVELRDNTQEKIVEQLLSEIGKYYSPEFEIKVNFRELPHLNNKKFKVFVPLQK